MKDMKKDNKQILKKIFTSPLFFLSVIIVFIFPLLIHILFKIQGNYYTVSVWNAEHILEYGATIIGSLIVYFTVVLTLIKNQEENKKIINNSHIEKKYENFTNANIELLNLINSFYELKISKLYDEHYDLEFITSEIEKLKKYSLSLNIIINRIQLNIPDYMREYFKNNYVNCIFFQFDAYLNNILEKFTDISFNYNPYKDKSKVFFELCNQYTQKLNSFKHSVLCHSFAFSDCFFEEDKFLYKKTSDKLFGNYDIAIIISNYEKLYK